MKTEAGGQNGSIGKFFKNPNFLSAFTHYAEEIIYDLCGITVEVKCVKNNKIVCLSKQMMVPVALSS